MATLASNTLRLFPQLRILRPRPDDCLINYAHE